MSREITIPAGEIVINVFQADDGVGVFANGREILHVDYQQSNHAQLTLSKGQSIDLRMEIYNLTGGTYRANIAINAGGKRIYEANPSGFTLPGWNIAWSDSFVITAE